MKWVRVVLKLRRKIFSLITRPEFILPTLRACFFKPAPPHRYRRRTQIPPATPKRRKPAWVIREIVRMKAQTGSSCHVLAAMFNHRFAASHGMTVGKTFVAETIKRHAYAIAALRLHWKRHVPAPLPRNAVWGLDLTGKGDATGGVHAIVGLVDYGSRLALRLHPVRQRSSIVLLKVILAAVETFGMPRVIKTDNEACFTSRLFRFGLAMLGIRHQLSPPGQPWHNGRIERLFLTLKQKLNQIEVADFGGLEQALIVFRCWYNAVRPHQHLQGRTPLDAWRGIDPFKQAPKSVTLFEAWEGLLTGYYMRR